jgi:hypothetical protein
MIGRIEFQVAGETVQATLEDDHSWSCSDRPAQLELERLAPAGSGWRPIVSQLYDAQKALPECRIVEEIEEPFDPDVDY